MTIVDILLLALLLGCVGAVAYPFALYPVVLTLLPRRCVTSLQADARSASLLFCAYNEGAAMPGKIANLAMLKTRHPDLQVLAFDDRSNDDTAQLLDARSDLLTLVSSEGRSGKAHGMKQLAALATGDVLIFTDANVALAPDAIDNLLAYYADPQVGGVLGSLQYEGGEGSATAAVGSLYWRIEEALKDRESATGNVMGADGSIFSIQRELYPDFPDTVLDDLTVSMAVVFAGKRLIKAKDVIAIEGLVSARGDEYRRKVRIAARAWHTHRYLRPALRRMARVDRFKYTSRKIVRWFGGVFIATGALAALALLWRLWPDALPFAVVGSAILALIGWRVRSGPIASVVDILLAYVATLQGIVRAMRGQVVATWSPAKSRQDG